MSRRSLKATLKSTLETVEGIRTVYEGTPKLAPNEVMPYIVISLPREDESRMSATAPIGKKRDQYTARLTLINIDTQRDPIVGELAFDDLVDAIKAKLREDVTLGGTVLGAGVDFIRTEVAEPRLVGQDQGNVMRGAVIEFDVVDIVTG